MEKIKWPICLVVLAIVVSWGLWCSHPQSLYRNEIRPKRNLNSSFVYDVTKKNSEALLIAKTPAAFLNVTDKIWENIIVGVDQLNSRDKVGLQKLYQETHDLIVNDPEGYMREVKKNLPDLLNRKLEVSFFIFSSWIRYSNHPTKIIQALWDYKRPEEKIVDYHHIPLNPMLRYDRILAYSYFELRSQMNKGKSVLAESENQKFSSQLANKLSSEPSYNLSIEMVKLLSVLNRTDLIDQSLIQRTDRDKKNLEAAIDENVIVGKN